MQEFVNHFPMTIIDAVDGSSTGIAMCQNAVALAAT